jgi:hypothetical protein
MLLLLVRVAWRRALAAGLLLLLPLIHPCITCVSNYTYTESYVTKSCMITRNELLFPYDACLSLPVLCLIQ